MEIAYEIRPNVLDNKKTNAKLKEIFEEWLNVIKDYCDYEDYEDSPYYYNERATLSSFVGAIWRQGEIALEEFSSIKGSASQNEDEDKKGRIDLWFKCGTDSFICEAKQKWHTIPYSIEKLVTDAKKDIEKSKKHYECLSSAMTFWTPMFKTVESIEDALNTLLHDVKNALKQGNIDMYCLIAPKKARNLQAGDGNYYPCVILLGNITSS